MKHFLEAHRKELEVTGGPVGSCPHLLWAHSEYLGYVYIQGSHGVVNDFISRNPSDLWGQSCMETIATMGGLQRTHPQ